VSAVAPTRRRDERAPARPRVRGGRRGTRTVAGLLLVAVAIGVFAVAQRRESGRQSVLMVTRDVPAGATLGGADLRAVSVVVGDGVDVEPASALARVVGRVVGVPLSAHSLLPPAAVGAARATPAGLAQVGAAVAAGAYPPDLAAGDHVRVVIAADAGGGVSSTGGTAGPVDVDGLVLAVRPAAQGDGGVVVVLQVDDPEAPIVAVAGAGSRVSLVREAPTG